MLKFALSLVALLTLASSSYAACLSPDKFPNSVRIAGADLVKFRKAAVGLPENVDLVLMLKNVPVVIGFVKGCAVTMGDVQPIRPTPAPAPAAKPADDGSI